MNPLETARDVLRTEAEAILRLAEALGPELEHAVELLDGCSGRIVLTGMGKSGLICRKIAATLSSTGAPAYFLHPAEGVHGDLGMLARGDVVVAVSNSGETSELVGILPAVRHLDLRLVAITGNRSSTLARRGDVVLCIPVEQEGGPLNLAPMASTTATLALGDALAAALMARRAVSAEDFARCHPAGVLGRALTLQVDDLMYRGGDVPRVARGAPMREAVLEMTSKRLGFTGVFEGERLVGIITDGDLRRGLQEGNDLLDRSAGDLMTANPKRVTVGTLAMDALRLMERHAITSLFVVGQEDPDRVAGTVHIHDLVKGGLR